MSKVFTAYPDGQFNLDGRTVRCALGRSGVVPASDKKEGDGATPAGAWPIRRVLYRPDRLPKPATTLEVAPLRPDDGWCDAPEDPNYNRPVRLPYPASHERLWRDDELYDLIVVLGYNDAPVVPEKGSAIFLHVARPDFGPTAGCVALAQAEVLDLLARAAPGDGIAVLDAISLAPGD